MGRRPRRCEIPTLAECCTRVAVRLLRVRRGVATPLAGLTRSGENETLRLGQRLEFGAFEWRPESELAEENRTLRAGYGYRVGDFLDLGVEASRREAANGDAPGHEITLRARMRW